MGFGLPPKQAALAFCGSFVHTGAGAAVTILQHREASMLGRIPDNLDRIRNRLP